jgi:hypothetical protein
LLSYRRTTQSAERLDSFARRWGLSKREDLAAQRDDEPYIVLIKKDRDEVVGMVGSRIPALRLDGTRRQLTRHTSAPPPAPSNPNWSAPLVGIADRTHHKVRIGVIEHIALQDQRLRGVGCGCYLIAQLGIANYHHLFFQN